MLASQLAECDVPNKCQLLAVGVAYSTPDPLGQAFLSLRFGSLTGDKGLGCNYGLSFQFFNVSVFGLVSGLGLKTNTMICEDRFI